MSEISIHASVMTEMIAELEQTDMSIQSAWTRVGKSKLPCPITVVELNLAGLWKCSCCYTWTKDLQDDGDGNDVCEDCVDCF